MDTNKFLCQHCESGATTEQSFEAILDSRLAHLVSNDNYAIERLSLLAAIPGKVIVVLEKTIDLIKTSDEPRRLKPLIYLLDATLKIDQTNAGAMLSQTICGFFPQAYKRVSDQVTNQHLFSILAHFFTI